MRSKKEKKKNYFDADKVALEMLNERFFHTLDLPEEKILSTEDRQGAAYTLVHWRDEFYRWKDGCYYRVPDTDMRSYVIAYLQMRKDTSLKKDEDVWIITQNVNNILLNLKGRVFLSSPYELNMWLDNPTRPEIVSLAFKNGILQFDPSKFDSKPGLVPLSPDFFNLVQLPYNYDPDATCKIWLDFLDDVMQGNEEYITLLQQWCGYLLRPDLREHKFLLYVGGGSNGKSVFSQVIEAFLGKENCSHVPLCRFSQPFPLYATLGKLANITNESSHVILEEGETTLKAFVAGDRFTFERKFKDSIEAVPTAKVMISTNALPRFNDKTQGIWRRILLVPFEKTIPPHEQIKGLAKEIIKTELPGIFNWAFEGLFKLNKNGGFIVPERNEELMDEYRRESDPARAFLLDNYTFSPNAGEMPHQEVYQQYTQFCKENNCIPLSGPQFGKQVRRVFLGVESKKRGPRDNRQHVYIGLVSVVSQQIPI